MGSGSGSMKPSDGPRERVRCKVDYLVKNAGQPVKMSVRCASDVYKMELNANIDQNGSALSGTGLKVSIVRGQSIRVKRRGSYRGESRARCDRRFADSSRKRKPPILRHGSTGSAGFAAFDRPCSRPAVNALRSIMSAWEPKCEGGNSSRRSSC
jgi:hypothetical protein